MIIEFIETFTREDSDYLWGSGIDLDDYDYALIMEYDPKKFRPDNSPISDYLTRMLMGCCENKWYRLKFKGSEKIIGIAYHG